MRILLVGLGSIGSRHKTNLEMAGVEVTVHDPPKGLVVSEWAGFDAAVIASPSDWHYLQTLCAMESGIKAVYVEKPPTKSWVQWAQLVSFAELWDVKLAVGYNWRFHPGVAGLKAHRPIQWAQFTSLEDVENWPNHGADHLRADGLLWTSVSHTIDLLTYLYGKLTVGRIRQMFGPCGTLVLDLLGEGFQIGVIASWLSPGQISVACGKRLDGVGFWADLMAPEWREAVTTKMHQDCLNAFLLWAAGGPLDERLCTGEQALDSLEVLEQCHVGRPWSASRRAAERRK